MVASVERANHLILELLKGGPCRAREILAAAEGANIAERTVQRAGEQMGVIKAKAGFAGGWTWELPSEDAKVEPAKAQVVARAETPDIHLRERAAAIATRLHKLETAKGRKGPFFPQDSRIQGWVRAGISDPDLKEAYEGATTDHKGMLTVGIMGRYVDDLISKGDKA
jgi:hypothetical protein